MQMCGNTPLIRLKVARERRNQSICENSGFEKMKKLEQVMLFLVQ